MTTEQKAKAYDEALERAKKLQETCDSMAVVGWCEYIFPELKESEDGKNKRISKEITQFLKQNNGWNREWLAWLEKQCQVKESIISQHEIEMCKENDNSLTGENERIKETLKEFVKGYSAFINGQWRLGDFTVNRLIAWLEKQGEHKPYGQRKECEDCQFNYAGECKGLCKMKRDEQKPADEDEPKFRPGDIVQYITDSTDRRRIEEIDTLCNMYHTDSSPIMFEVEDEWKVVVNAEDVEQESVDKVEPMFNEGDWVVYDHRTYQVVELPKEGYINLGLRRNGKVEFAPSPYLRHWTIQDAKDGDILATWAGAFIYNGNNDGIGCPGSYCGINTLGRFQIGGEKHWTGKKVYPATKEQRDTLFAKMKEAGYEWDSDKKELKKIEVVSKESEDEQIMKWCISHFRACFRVTKDNVEYQEYLNNKVIPWLEKQGHMLDPGKVIAWLNDQACQGWIEDVEVDKFVAKFKQDFGL